VLAVARRASEQALLERVGNRLRLGRSGEKNNN
jgi:hypothetical protein